MECVLKEETISQFLIIFKQYKNISEYISFYVYTDKLYIQNMDVNKICLCEITINAQWFDSYTTELDSDNDSLTFHIKSETLSKILSTYESGQTVKLKLVKNDKFIMTFCHESNKNTFRIPLQEITGELIQLNGTDYDLSFKLKTKKFESYCTQIGKSGSYIKIHCDENNIQFATNDVDISMDIDIPINVLDYYDIVEDYVYTHTFDNKYFSIITGFKNISENVFAYLQTDNPLKLVYSVNNDLTIIFYIAPQIDNE